MSTKSKMRKKSMFFGSIYFISLVFIFFHLDIYAMGGPQFGVNLSDLKGALGKKNVGSDQGAKQNSPRPAMLSLQDISSFEQAVKKLDVNTVKNLVNANPAFLTNSRVSAIKSVVQAPSNDVTRGKHLELLKFLLGQAANPNLTFMPTEENALDVAAKKIDSYQKSQDQDIADFYREVARELVAKGATLRKNKNFQFIIDQLDSSFSSPEILSTKESEIIKSPVSEENESSRDPFKLRHPTRSRPVPKRTHKVTSARVKTQRVDQDDMAVADLSLPEISKVPAISQASEISKVPELVQEQLPQASVAAEPALVQDLPSLQVDVEPLDLSTPLPSVAIAQEPSPEPIQIPVPEIPVPAITEPTFVQEVPSLQVDVEPVDLSTPLPSVVESSIQTPAAEAEQESASYPMQVYVSKESALSPEPTEPVDIASHPLSSPLPEASQKSESIAINDLGGNFYQVLGLSSDASDSDIKKAYHRLSLKYHPDKNKENLDESTEIFKKINDAYVTLSDQVKRLEYDNFLGEKSQQSEKDNPQYKISDLREAIKNFDSNKAIEIINATTFVDEPRLEVLKIILKTVTPKNSSETNALLEIFVSAVQKAEDVDLFYQDTERPETALDVAFDRLEKHFAEGNAYAASFYDQAMKFLIVYGANLMRFESDKRAQELIDELNDREAYSVDQIEAFFKGREMNQLEEFRGRKVLRKKIEARKKLEQEYEELENEHYQEVESFNVLLKKYEKLVDSHKDTEEQIEQTNRLIEDLQRK